MNLRDAKPGQAVLVLMPTTGPLTNPQPWSPGEILYINSDQKTLCIKMSAGTVSQLILGCDNGWSSPRVMRTRRLK